MKLELTLPDPNATVALGQALARSLPARAVAYLEGDLGAGKTTLARALLQEMGVRGAVRSPTYTLIERYPLQAGEAVHLDLYRIADPEELDYLGLDDLAASARLWLVEWAERGRGALPAADLSVQLAQDRNGRHVTLLASTAAGEAWLSALVAAAPPALGSLLSQH